jgi:hypothetical protein
MPGDAGMVSPLRTTHVWPFTVFKVAIDSWACDAAQHKKRERQSKNTRTCTSGKKFIIGNEFMAQPQQSMSLQRIMSNLTKLSCWTCKVNKI